MCQGEFVSNLAGIYLTLSVCQSRSGDDTDPFTLNTSYYKYIVLCRIPSRNIYIVVYSGMGWE